MPINFIETCLSLLPELFIFEVLVVIIFLVNHAMRLVNFHSRK